MIYHHSFGNHRLMKKILSVCVVLALICSISIPTFAEDTANSTESNSAQQPTLEITEGSLADESQNDTEAEESQVLDAQTADQNQDMSSEQVSETGEQDQADENGAVYADSKGSPYKLYTYTLLPDKTVDSPGKPDNIWNGMGVGSISGVNDPRYMQIGTIVYDSNSIAGASIIYPTSYPDITFGERIYKYAQTSSEKLQKGYYTITWFRVIVSDGANEGKNQHNKPIVESSINTYHLDGYIILNEENTYTVDFKLKDVGDKSFDPVNPEVYTQRVNEETTTDKLKVPTVEDTKKYPKIKTDANGIQYQFDGWYQDEACTQTVDFDSNTTIKQNTTFYGKYVPMTTSVTITKKVTGSLGDRTKDFAFTYTINGGDPQSFTLQHDGTHTVEDVPIGSTITITETDYSNQGYKTSYKVNSREDTTGNSAQITVSNDANQVEFTNNKDVTPDTGLYLTSWPYLMMLALVTGGALVFFMRRRRRS